MVNNCRRLFPAYRRVHELLRSEEYGAVVNVRISDGSPFEWSSVSDFYLRNPLVAKGVFLDRGAHTVDIVCWWLSGIPKIVDAKHDALGGAEARMNVQMAFDKTAVQLAFSRLFKLENCYTIDCEKAQITGRLFQSTRFEIVRNGKVARIRVGKPALYHEYAWQLLENFIQVVRGVASPLFTAADVAPSIELIDKTYQRATPFELPWYDADPNLALLRSLAVNHNR
jgi:predicted dehydrogenase